MSDDIAKQTVLFDSQGQDKVEQAYEDMEKASKAFEDSQKNLTRGMKVSIDTSNKKAKSVAQLSRAVKRAENDIKTNAQSLAQGRITSKEYQNDINNISAALKKMGLQDAQKKVSAYGRMVSDNTRTLKQNESAHKALQQQKRRTTTSTTRLATATRNATSHQHRVRESFLRTANSIAILDGPLGGIASRFSAFGVLVGRSGIALAAFAVTVTTAIVAITRAVRSFSEFEVQIATIENRLNAFGNRIGMTTDEIVRLSNEIARTTLANERQVMGAASQLLTFRNISTSIFEDILKSAQDLAASGFGTIESETLRLAKALEDPRQGLTSLSRAGITFTRQQREMIIALVDSGKQLEAYRMVLENVDKQVGGAGLAQANDTLAGSFDTIGQALRELARESGEFVADSFLGDFIERKANVARAFLDFLEGPSLEDNLRDESRILGQLNKDVEILSRSLEHLQAMQDKGIGGSPKALASQIEAMQERRSQQQAIVDGLQEEVQLEEDRKALKEITSQLDNRVEGLNNLQSQIDLQKEFIGLTQEEIRIRRILASEGYGGAVVESIEEEIEAYTRLLFATGATFGEIVSKVKEKQRELEEARDIAEELFQVFEDQNAARELNRIMDSIDSGNESLRVQIRLMKEGHSATEAARLATVEKEKALLQGAAAAAIAAETIATIEGNLDAAKEAAIEFAKVMDSIAGLEEREFLLKERASLSTRESGGSGGGGGADPNAEYQRELDALTNYLERRREQMMIANGLEGELIAEQYEDRHQVLVDALERELITRQEYADMFQELELSKEQVIKDQTIKMRQDTIDAAIGLLGIFAQRSKAAAKALIAINTALRVSEIIQDASRAAVMALAIYGPTPKGYAAAAKAKAYGAKQAAIAVAAGALRIGSAGGSDGGGGGGGRSEADAPAAGPSLPPQRILVQGIDPNAFYTGEQLNQLFEAFYEENDNRGKVFVVSQ